MENCILGATGKNVALYVLLLSAVVASGAVYLGGCSSGGSSGSPQVNTSIQLSGSIGTGYTVTQKPGFFAKLFSFAEEAYAVGEPMVDKIVAVCFSDQNLTISEATIGNGKFSVDVDKGYPQLLVFLSGTTTVGIYRVDNGTDLDVFPLNSNSTNIDLGTVSLNGNRMEGTIPQTDLLNAISIDPTLAGAFGVMDNGLMRLSSLDVDGNGTLDVAENKYFEFKVSYEFKTTQSLAAIQGAFADHTLFSPDGYFYIYHDNGSLNSSLDWSTATLTTPAAIDGSTSWLQTMAFVAPDGGAGLNFTNAGNTNNFFLNPSTPPSGTYVITVNKLSGGTQALTFNNWQSRSVNVDTNMYDIYIPAIKLTMAGSRISKIDWQWWKRRSSDGTWVQPSDQELSLVIDGTWFEFGNPDPAGQRVSGELGLTTTGSVVPATQTYDAFFVRVAYWDKAGYGYGFDWR